MQYKTIDLAFQVLWDEPQKNSNDGFFTADYSQSGGGGEFNAAPPFNYSYPSPTDPTNFDDEKPLLEGASSLSRFVFILSPHFADAIPEFLILRQVL